MPNPRLVPGQPPRSIRFDKRKAKKANGTTRTVVRARCYIADEFGKRREVSASGPTQTAAKRALYEALGHTPERPKVINGKTKLHVFAEIMFAEKRAKVTAGQMSPGSMRAYKGHWNRYIEPALGDIAIEWLTVRVADDYLKTLRETRGYATVKGIRSVLTEICEAAVIYEVIDRNPVKKAADIPGGAIKQVHALAASEAADLWRKLTALSQGALLDEDGEPLEACHRDVPDLVLWMLSTGDRISNALAPHWPWLDLEEATAQLGPNVIRVPGEGLRLNEDTSKSRRAVLGLPGQCVEMLKLRRGRALNLAGPVFPDSFGGLRDPSNTSKQLKAAFTAVGYGHITSHWFRKTVGSELDRAGLPTSEVAAQLRHADQRTTERHYMEKRSVNQRATDALEAMLATEPDRKVVNLRS